MRPDPATPAAGTLACLAGEDADAGRLAMRPGDRPGIGGAQPAKSPPDGNVLAAPAARHHFGRDNDRPGSPAQLYKPSGLDLLASFWNPPHWAHQGNRSTSCVFTGQILGITPPGQMLRRRVVTEPSCWREGVGAWRDGSPPSSRRMVSRASRDVG